MRGQYSNALRWQSTYISSSDRRKFGLAKPTKDELRGKNTRLANRLILSTVGDITEEHEVGGITIERENERKM